MRALARDERGHLVFSGQAGAANLASTPEPALLNHLRLASKACPPPRTVCGCFAGLMDNSDRERAERILHRLFPKATVRAEPDFAATLRASAPTDVCVIAGTGSLVCSMARGEPVKSGGRGHLLGDEGSGFQFGRDALIAYLDAPEQVSEGLKADIEKGFRTLDPARLVANVYRSSSPVASLAKLAKPLGRDAEAGFPYAQRIVENNLRALAKIVKGHIEMHFLGAHSVRMTLAGGLWKSSGIYKQSFALELSRAMSDLEMQIQTIKRPPVEGAVSLAKEINFGN